MKAQLLIISLIVLISESNAQNVGIGTTTPVNKLSVNGKVNITDSLAIGIPMPSAMLHLQSSNTDNEPKGDIIFSRYWNTNADTRASSIFHYNNSAGNSDNLAFGVAGNGGTMGQPNSLAQIKMLIQANGNVGIGTLTPATKLEVAGTMKATTLQTSNLQITNGAANGYVLKSNAAGNATWVNPNSLGIALTETDPEVGTLTHNKIPRWDASSLIDGSIFDNGINIGIGTGNPGTALDVRSLNQTQITVGSLSGTGGALYLGSSDYVLQRGYPAEMSNNNLGLSLPTGNGGIYLSTTGKSMSEFVFKNTRLGIGTTADPVYALDIRSGDAFINLGGANKAIYFGNNTSGLQYGYPNLGTNGSLGLYTNGYPVYLSSSGRAATEFYLSGGQVGIGTHSPASTLDVRGGTGAAITVGNINGYLGALYLGNSAYGVVRGFDGMNDRVGLYSSGSDLYLSTHGNSGSNSTLDFVLKNNSNVGIGTNVPDNKLTVNGNANFTGSVGIGVTYAHPDCQLEINGKVRATGYQCRRGSGGPYAGSAVSNFFIYDWTGTWLQAYVDNVPIGPGISSDRRLKENIHPMAESAIGKVMQLKPVTFKYKDIPGSIFRGNSVLQEGFVADELQLIIPSAVTGKKDAVTEDGSIAPQTVIALPLVSVLTKAVQEQQQQIQELQKQILELKKLIEAKN